MHSSTLKAKDKPSDLKELTGVVALRRLHLDQKAALEHTAQTTAQTTTENLATP